MIRGKEEVKGRTSKYFYFLNNKNLLKLLLHPFKREPLILNVKISNLISLF